MARRERAGSIQPDKKLFPNENRTRTERGKAGYWLARQCLVSSFRRCIRVHDAENISLRILGVGQPADAGYGYLGHHDRAAVGLELGGELIDRGDIDRVDVPVIGPCTDVRGWRSPVPTTD